MKSETEVQQRVRFKVARSCALAWRNNVGATSFKCPSCKTDLTVCPCCGTRQRPVRYGLANDSQKVNEKIKSSDLILAIPRIITPDMVGQTIAQFGSLETKREGWRYSGNEREQAQKAWIELINRIGGYAAFTTGKVEL